MRSHTAIWGKALIEELEKRGISRERALGNTGITFKALDQQISFEKLATLFERAAELTGDDLIGFHLGVNLEFKRGGLLVFVAIASPTSRTLLVNFARFQSLNGNALKVDVENLPEIVWRFRVPARVERRQYIEFGCAGMIDMLRQLTGRQLSPEKVEFKHYRKTGVAQLRKFFGCSVKFGCAENKIVFKQRDLDLPLRSSDDHLFHLLVEIAEERSRVIKPSIVSLIEAELSKNPSAHRAEIARRLGFSPRTMARRLTDEGMSFAKVVEEYRAAMARRMMSESDLHMTEVAFVLGYADLSSFSTAFKRWTGQTPSEFRRTTHHVA